MHVTLFKALKRIKMDDDLATDVVEALEDFMASKITEANKGLEAKIQGVESQLKAQTWVIGAVGLLIAVIGLAPAWSKLFS